MENNKNQFYKFLKTRYTSNTANTYCRQIKKYGIFELQDIKECEVILQKCLTDKNPKIDHHHNTSCAIKQYINFLVLRDEEKM